MSLGQVTEAVAVARNIRMSPFKTRLVVDQIRGQSVEQALRILGLSRKYAAVSVRHTLKSAIANAENNFGMDVDQLVVSRAMVDGGAMIKRFQPRARGRANRILKPTCHITIAVSPRDWD
ncbi:MAG: 50S ribosomal protein L22 [Magnetococcales bacterium]|nr:50S ribosomal protein L22 [Magnetococcales bacterium]